MSRQEWPLRLIGWTCVGALGLVLSGPLAVHANPMAYQFTGVVDSADPASGAAAGSTFTGTFSYDPSIDPGDILGQTITFVRPFDPPNTGGPSFTFGVNGQTLIDEPRVNMTQSDPNNFSLLPSTSPTTLTVFSSYWANGNLFHTDLVFSNPTGVTFTDFGPTSPLSLANFSAAKLNVWNPDTAGDVWYSGTITSLTPMPVPEPASTTVLCVATAGWLAWGRRRPRRA
jgi:hypothetical protein